MRTLIRTAYELVEDGTFLVEIYCLYCTLLVTFQSAFYFFALQDCTSLLTFYCLDILSDRICGIFLSTRAWCADCGFRHRYLTVNSMILGAKSLCGKENELGGNILVLSLVIGLVLGAISGWGLLGLYSL